jgi:hypothetical protein
LKAVWNGLRFGVDGDQREQTAEHEEYRPAEGKTAGSKSKAI